MQQGTTAHVQAGACGCQRQGGRLLLRAHRQHQRCLPLPVCSVNADAGPTKQRFDGLHLQRAPPAAGHPHAQVTATLCSRPWWRAISSLTLPAAAARCSGVLPRLSLAPARAPCSSSSGISAVLPLLACSVAVTFSILVPRCLAAMYIGWLLHIERPLSFITCANDSG